MAEIRQLGIPAVIFDCNETLVDSAAAHFHAMQDAVAVQGLRMDRVWYTDRRGRNAWGGCRTHRGDRRLARRD